jgi:hypothetical protein
MLLLGSMITFNAPCGRLDLGDDRAHGADTASAPSPLAVHGRQDRAAAEREEAFGQEIARR